MKNCYNCINYVLSQDRCKYNRTGLVQTSKDWARPMISFVKQDCNLHEFSKREQEYQEMQERIKSYSDLNLEKAEGD